MMICRILPSSMYFVGFRLTGRALLDSSRYENKVTEWGWDS
jgi:hypothetical protein